MVAIPLGENTNTLLVVTPAAATTVIAVQDGREVARAQVKDAGAVLKVPSAEGLTVQALDAQGVVVGSGQVAVQGRPVDAILAGGGAPVLGESHWDSN